MHINQQKSRVPRFKVFGQLDSSVCRLVDPFSGELVVDYCEAPIRSVELQLVRVETCGCAEGYAKEGIYRLLLLICNTFLVAFSSPFLLQLPKSRTFK